MEARRTFVGARSYKQVWIMLAALLCAAALAVGVAFIGSGAISGSAKPPLVVHPAPGSVLNQDNGKGLTTQDLDRKSNPGNQTVNTSKPKQTVF